MEDGRRRARSRGVMDKERNMATEECMKYRKERWAEQKEAMVITRGKTRSTNTRNPL